MKYKSLIIALSLALCALLVTVQSGSAIAIASRTASIEGASSIDTTGANSTNPLTAVGNGFSYQGSLKSGGSPASGQYDFQFTLYDSLAGGSLAAGPITTANVTVANGLFTVVLDFGASAITGEARYMEIAVRQAGGGTYTILAPRQPLTPAPYALSLKPGAVISGTTGTILTAINAATGSGLYGSSTNGFGVEGGSPNGGGVYGHTTNGEGVFGVSTYGRGVSGLSTNSEGVHGETGSDFAGVFGYNTSTGNIGPGVRGDSNSGPGVYGLSTSVGKAGVIGVGTNYEGVRGETNSFAPAVIGINGGTGQGVQGYAVNGPGVYGIGISNEGVHGETGSNYAGVYGHNTASGIGPGVRGDGNGGPGVYGISTSNYAGYFQGNVRVTGSCCSSSAGTYQIDDPLDPANKYLNHAAVESQDMLDVLNGNTTTDSKGDAVVTLPAYFEATNRDFRYQLTVLGQFSQVIVSSEIQNNTFSIKTDKPNVKVSWQVTGIRNDPYAQQNPITVEQSKPADEKGYYLHPELYGQSGTKSVDPLVRNPLKNQPQPVEAVSPLPAEK